MGKKGKYETEKKIEKKTNLESSDQREKGKWDNLKS